MFCHMKNFQHPQNYVLILKTRVVVKTLLEHWDFTFYRV